MVWPMLAAAAVGAASSLAQGAQERSAAKKQAKAYDDALMMIQDNMNRRYGSLYGASADKDGMTTGDPYQDYLLQALTKEVQQKEIEAAALNASQATQTDLDAQKQAMLQMIMQKNAANSQALANAGITARRTGMGNAGQLNWQANRSAVADRNTAYNQAKMATQDNLNRLAAGTNLNTGSIADQNRQMAQQLYGAANQNYQNMLNMMMQTKTAQNQAKANIPTWGNIGMGALTGGLQAGVSYGLSEYGAQQNFNRQKELLSMYLNRGGGAPQTQLT